MDPELLSYLFLAACAGWPVTWAEKVVTQKDTGQPAVWARVGDTSIYVIVRDKPRIGWAPGVVVVLTKET